MNRRSFLGIVAGSLLAPPIGVAAQQVGKSRRIGVLWHAGNAEEEEPYFTALLAGFKDLGHVDGKNITFLHRFPNEVPERFERLAAELVSLNLDVLVSVGSVAPSYAKRATKTVPVVFILVADPVGGQLVESLSRPGGNVTGLSQLLERPDRRAPSDSHGGHSTAVADLASSSIQTPRPLPCISKSLGKRQPSWISMTWSRRSTQW